MGGGIYKAGSDIGSELATRDVDVVSEYDKRNSAAILDIVGDYVGKIGGFTSDIIGSFCFCLVAAVLIGGQYAYVPESIFQFQQVPIYIVVIGLVASSFAKEIIRVRISLNKITNILLETVYIAIFISATALFILMKYLPYDIIEPGVPFKPYLAYICGLVTSVLIAFTSEFFTSYRFAAARNIAKESNFGTVIALLSAFKTSSIVNALYILFILAMLLVFVSFSRPFWDCNCCSGNSCKY